MTATPAASTPTSTRPWWLPHCTAAATTRPKNGARRPSPPSPWPAHGDLGLQPARSFIAAGSAITIAVDDTLFHRYGVMRHAGMGIAGPGYRCPGLGGGWGMGP